MSLNFLTNIKQYLVEELPMLTSHDEMAMAESYAREELLDNEGVDNIEQDDLDFILKSEKKLKKSLKDQRLLVEEMSKDILQSIKKLDKELVKLLRIKGEIKNISSHLEKKDIEKAKDSIDNLKINPLNEILKATGYCTVFEDGPGFLRRKFRPDVPKSEQRMLNSDLVSRIRFILNEICPTFTFKTIGEIKDELDSVLKTAYKQYAGHLIDKNNIEKHYDIEYFVRDNAVINFIILLDGCNNNFYAKFDIVINGAENKILFSSQSS